MCGHQSKFATLEARRELEPTYFPQLCMGLFVAIARRSATGHFHDDVILLLRPESFRDLLTCTNYVFCYFNLAGITKFN